MILTLSPSSLNALQECPTKYNFQSIRRLRQIETSESGETRMNEGKLFHEMLELHYNALLEGSKPDILAISESSREKYRNDEYEHEVTEACIKNYQEYAVHYEADGWIPKAVEVPFSKILFQNDQHQIVIEGVIDLIVSNHNSTFVVDHKTVSKKDGYPTTLSNQFKAYAWATESSICVKNDIGFQKTLGPAERFQRHVLSYTTDILDEWRENVIYHGLEAINFIEKEYFPRREASCFKCWFKQICEATPDSREWKIQSKYKVGEAYDIYNRKGK